MKVFDSLRKRHSAYDLSKISSLSDAAIVEVVKEAVLLTPSSMNSQSQRVAILFGDKSDAFWDLTREALKKVAPEEGFERTVEKLEKFKGQGTILFYADTNTTKNLEESYPLYKENFATWAQQENAMLQLVVWSALAERGIGASLQHYNPVIDEDVVNTFGIDPTWKLVAQMPFGGADFEFTPKEKLPLEKTVIVVK